MMYWGYLFGIQEVFSAIGECAFNDENKENIKYKKHISDIINQKWKQCFYPNHLL